MTRRIHIVGSCPRTGTTLLCELVRHGFETDGPATHERPVYEPPEKPWDVWVTKRPGDILLARRALAIDPRLWILHMVRDPRDVVVSRHRREPDRYWANLGMWKRYRAAARRVEPHPRVLTLRYEDLVREPDAVQERIAEWLPFLRRAARFSQVHRDSDPDPDSLDALGSVRAPSPESIGSWRRHRERLAGQLAQHGPIDADLLALGYETDDAWHRALDGVTPDTRPSHFDEHPPALRRLRQWRKMQRRLRRYRGWAKRNAAAPLDVAPADAGPFALRRLETRRALLEIGVLGKGPPVLLLPRLAGAATEQYGTLALALAERGFQAIALNPRGVGRSRGDLEGLRLADLAADAADVIEGLGTPAHVIGAAYGNRVARCLAERHPTLVRSLVLLAAGGRFPAEARPPGPKSPWPEARRAQRRAEKSAEPADWWGGGSAPMLVIQGLDDRVAVPANGRALAEEHPDRVTLVELEGVAHRPLDEAPERVIDEAARFLARREQAEGGAPGSDAPRRPVR